MKLLLKTVLILQLFACKLAFANIFLNNPILKPVKIDPGTISVKVKWAIATADELVQLCPENDSLDSNAGCVVFENEVCIVYTGDKAVTHVVLGERMLECSQK